MNDHELDLLLEHVRSDDGSHLGSVKGRVMARVEAEDGVGRGFWFAALAAAAAVLAFAMLMPYWTARTEGLTIRRPELPAPPPAMAYTIPRPRPRSMPVTRRTRIPVVVTAEAGPLEVRMQTDDPDVLIIWLIDGDQEEGNP